MTESKPKNPLVELELHVKNRPQTLQGFEECHCELCTWIHALVGKTQALQQQHEDVFQALSKLEDWVTGKHLGDFDPELVCIMDKVRKVLGK